MHALRPTLQADVNQATNRIMLCVCCTS